MKLYVLDHGKIVMLASNPVTRDGAGCEPPAIPIHTFLLDTAAGYLLFDAACHPRAMEGAWPEELCANPYIPGEGGGLAARLKQLDVKPEDISTLVLSHLHLDHAGCAHLFPQAKIYVHQQELEHVMRDAANDALSAFHQRCDVDSWQTAGLRWSTVPTEVRELPLCAGVTILNLGPGHSYGMLGLLVELACGNLLLASDAIYSRDHFEPTPQLAGIVHDETGYFATMEYLRRCAEKHSATILFGHDMAQFSALKKSTEGYYE